MGIHKIDDNSFEDIFEAYFTPICRFLNLYTKDISLIEDIVQEVFCNLWVSRDFLQVKHIKSYLYTSARNKMLNHIRDNKLHAAILATYIKEDQELQSAYDCIDEDEFINRLETIIDDLPAKCKHIFKQSRYSKMTYKEIAEKECISEKMVEKHISTALRKIKEKMAGTTFILL